MSVKILTSSVVFVENIPITVLSDRSLSPLEAICLYLKEQGLTNHQIAQSVGRDDRTIWTVINRAKKKRARNPKPFLSVSDVEVPLSLLKNRVVSALEAISHFLYAQGLTYHQIAQLLQRDDRTIWTSVKRYEEKMKEVLA
jgi:DNA-binding CsgD family transcriptional regulator